MKRFLASVAVVLVLAACDPAPQSVTPTPPVASSASPTPSPKGSPIVSAKGFITMSSPTTNAKLQSPVIISGDASVFEAALQWRITDTAGAVILEGITTASQGAPGRGTFTVSVPYALRASEVAAFVEVFSRSPKDGSIDDLVRVPVTLR